MKKGKVYWGVLYGGLALFVLVVISMMVCKLTSGRAASQVVVESAASAVVQRGRLCHGDADCRPALMFHGSVDADSMGRLKAELERSPGVQWVCLSSPGGQADAARAMEHYLRSKKLSTCVAARRMEPKEAGAPVQWLASECGSACSQVWLGGQQRLLALKGADVGFHRAFDGTADCCLVNNFLRASIERVREYGDGRKLGDADARSHLAAKASQCGPSEFYKLRAPEALRLGLVSADHATAGWDWRPDDVNAPYPSNPVGADCG